MSDIILQIKNLNVEFPVFGGILQREVSHVHAVNNVNLDIKSGKTIGTGRPSLAQDLLKGRSTEADYLNGYIVNKGKEVNISTPVNQSIVDLTRQIENGLIQPSMSNVNLIKKSKK